MSNPREFVNRLTANDLNSLPKSQKLPQPIQMEFSQKRIIVSELFPPLLKSISMFKHCERKDDPHSFCILEIPDRK